MNIKKNENKDISIKEIPFLSQSQTMIKDERRLTILLTGNLGFVGNETQKYLMQKGFNVIGYDLMANADIRDNFQLEMVFSQNLIDRVLHLAAIARFSDARKNPKIAFETNSWGTRNIAIAARKYHVPMIYASTGSVYMPIESEPPINEDFAAEGNSTYGCSKYLGEIYVQEHAYPWIILRYSHLYGKEKRMHGLVGGFLERIERGSTPILYGGRQSNDFCYIKDIAHANYLALTAPWDKWNQIYNIGTGQELSAEEAGKIICKISNYKGKVEKKNGRTVDPDRFVFDISKADRMLGFKAFYDFENGLKDMLQKND